MSSILQAFSGNKVKGVSFPEPPTSSNPNERPPVRSNRIDFPTYNLPEYANRTAFVIDNLFTLDDCTRLLAAAESKSGWVPAELNAGGDGEYSGTSYRGGGRILHDDEELAQWILDKLQPYLSEIEIIEGARHHGRRGSGAKLNAHLLRLNERLRFLRYGPGEFFQAHMDGSYATPDKKQVSYYTLQIYLNGDKKSLGGGATRFWSKGYWPSSIKTKKSVHYVDVESRTGRVLIFEHEGLIHSGEEVTKGVKYSMRTDFMYVANEVESPTQTNNDTSLSAEKADTPDS